MLKTQNKINVFISSSCGKDRDQPEKYKYNLAREGLKNLIESTNLANVYVFESEGASTYSAGQHYTYGLEDCDVCIFLIDNYDGIPDGVQSEIDTVNKHGIKSLYYFCDERSKKETPLQRSLKGSKFAKSKIVNTFEDFITMGAKDLIEELVIIYRGYCKGRIDFIDDNEKKEEIAYSLVDSYFSKDNLFKKSVLGNTDNVKRYFFKKILSQDLKVESTSKLDEICSNFLSIMFDNKSIQEFNVNILLKEIQKEQVEEHYEVTEIRWQAIQNYYLGEIENCISDLKEALNLAKENKLPQWIIKDILIDLRNQKSILGQKNNTFFINDEYQEEIISSRYLLNYPLMDRFTTNFYNDILKNDIKSRIQPPHTIVFGHNLNSPIEDLCGVFVLSMMNGSLTHINLIYDKIKKLLFYCCERYSDWNFKLMLIKISIITCNSKEIDRTVKYFDEIICKMDSKDANEVYNFAENIPIKHKNFIAKLEALSIIGYFMNDNDFNTAWEEIKKDIIIWIESKNAVVAIGSHIYRMLANIHFRVDKDELALICYKTLESNKNRFSRDVFDLIGKSININEISDEIRTKLLDETIELIKNEESRKSVNNIDVVLYTFRKQSKILTENLDKAIAEYMPKFYMNNYKLEVSQENEEIIAFIDKFLSEIEERNVSQGENGKYIGYRNNPHLTIKNILKQSNIDQDDKKIDDIFKVASNTLLAERQTIDEKIEAIELLVYLCKKYPNIISGNSHLVFKLLENKKLIESGQEMMSNLGEMHLHFSSLLLYSSLGEEVWIEMIASLANMGETFLSQIHSSRSILNFLESSVESILDHKLESIILQNAFKWCKSNNRDVRWYAVNILFSLLRNPMNHEMICDQLVKHMDFDNAYIKNTILRNLQLIKEIDLATFDYILQKASIDTNYVVREVYKEIKEI